jgi:hypothetical protein
MRYSSSVQLRDFDGALHLTRHMDVKPASILLMDSVLEVVYAA